MEVGGGVWLQHLASTTVTVTFKIVLLLLVQRPWIDYLAFFTAWNVIIVTVSCNCLEFYYCYSKL